MVCKSLAFRKRNKSLLKNDLTQEMKSSFLLKDKWKQESIPVGCVLPPWKLYVLQFQWPLPQMNKFEQVSSDYHQMQLNKQGVGARAEGACTWIMGNGDKGTPPEQNNR